MEIKLNGFSNVPIYEQIMNQMKNQIIHHELEKDTMLPSIRVLANELNVSVITTKKVYDELLKEGFIYTIPQKGSFVKDITADLGDILRKEIKEDIKNIVRKAEKNGISKEELRILMEEGIRND